MAVIDPVSTMIHASGRLGDAFGCGAPERQEE
jgi:hypothetical protein